MGSRFAWKVVNPCGRFTSLMQSKVSHGFTTFRLFYIVEFKFCAFTIAKTN